MEQRKDIAFYIKMFPLKSHLGSYEKAKGILCKHSLESLDEVFAGKPAPKADCPAPELDDNIKLGERLGITGTPAFILPDGMLGTGFLQADQFINVIDQAWKKKEEAQTAGKAGK